MEIQGYNGEWSARGQVRMDLSIVPRIVRLGFKRIHVGIESLDQNVLDFFNKAERVSDIDKFCKVMTENGVDILGYFIIGAPMETKEYREALGDRIRELGIKYLFLNMLFPEPDTKYYSDLMNEGLVKEDYWKAYFKNPTPDFVPPYPYGEEKQKEILEFADKITEEFKCDI